ncbi:hypothetical protein PG994_014020 [Apiospora phragmitis]|uniref:Uncharacterized protein n=1 Tax=Apiospora phragmitis TaxID=2905665 RepID=A0ABR1T5H7_9PEZI
MVAKDLISRLQPADSIEYLRRRPKDFLYYAKLDLCPWMDPHTDEILRDPSQEELIVYERGTQEYRHLRSLQRSNTRLFPGAIFGPQFLPTGGPAGLSGRHALDTCNKSVALYTIGHDTLPILNYLYRKWLRPFENPIEFGEFIAKMIEIDLGQFHRAFTQLASTEELQGVVEGIIRLHQQIIHDIRETFQGRGDTLGLYNQEDYDNLDNYDFMPLSGSLIIVTKELPTGVQDDLSQMQVYLILTGADAEFSAPISFETLYTVGQVLNADYDCGTQPNLFLTTLEAAVEFVQEVERRELQVCGVRLDPTLAAPGPIDIELL